MPLSLQQVPLCQILGPKVIPLVSLLFLLSKRFDIQQWVYKNVRVLVFHENYLFIVSIVFHKAVEWPLYTSGLYIKVMQLSCWVWYMYKSFGISTEEPNNYVISLTTSSRLANVMPIVCVLMLCQIHIFGRIDDVRLSVCLSVYLFVCLSVCLSVCPSVRPSTFWLTSAFKFVLSHINQYRLDTLHVYRPWWDLLNCDLSLWHWPWLFLFKVT